MSQKFWMVLGRGVPNVRHTTKAAAEKEAERLAKQHATETFVVLESVKAVKVSGVEWTDYSDPPVGGWRHPLPSDPAGTELVYCIHDPSTYHKTNLDRVALVVYTPTTCTVSGCGLGHWHTDRSNLWVYDEDLPF